MKRINHKKQLTTSIILLLILVIGIGYAYLTSNLSITGQTEVVANTWNIHFENLNVKDGSVTASTPATIQSNNVDITYSITLSRPKEYYEFTVDVKNDGTLPGKVSISTLSGITNDAASVVDYRITYKGGNSVNIGDIINAGAKKSIKVRVYYKDDISATDFPSNNLNLTLTYTLQYVQSDEDVFDTDSLIEQLKTQNSTCFTKYTGQVTDQVGETVTASNVYFNKCADKRNIIFNNTCWQMIRTTETGGIKMIYNGEPDGSGQCVASRGNHKGIVQSGSGTIQTINSSYLYGSSFTIDTSTNKFTLTDTTTATWSDSTYENLLGKFTCKTSGDTCTTLYQINSYYSNTNAYLSYYTIDNTNYAQIGESSFNANGDSLAMVGYMFNKVYNFKSGVPASGSLMGNDVTYSNGTYTLLPASGEINLGNSLDAIHHYTCNNTTGICNKVRFYYYNDYYIELDGESDIEEAINNMLHNDNVNRYNSSIKGIIDAWYKQNMISKTNMLEDTVYCNARNITNYGGWNLDGGILSEPIFFKNYYDVNDLSCTNLTDQFSISNNKAKLTYPVSLINNEELYNIGTNSLIQTGNYYWDLSPGIGFVGVRFVFTDGSLYNGVVFSFYGTRPAVSLASSVIITEGDGSESNPFVISE